MIQQEEKALAVQRLQRMEAYRQEQLLKKMEEDARKIEELAEVCVLLKVFGFHLQCSSRNTMHRVYTAARCTMHRVYTTALQAACNK